VYHVNLDLNADQVYELKRIALERYTTVTGLATEAVKRLLKRHGKPGAGVGRRENQPGDQEQ
jgi:hypothetical protein